MTASIAPEPLYLPPLFALHRVECGAFEAACAMANEAGAGALFLEERPGVLGFSVVLEPDEPLAAARRAFVVGMAAATDALLAHSPPGRSVRIAWPDVLVHDACRIGGGRLAWQEVSEAATPGWLVFGAELIADRDDLDETGRHAESVSLREEEFGENAEIVRSFAQNLMLRMEIWDSEGFDAAAEGYLARLLSGASGSAHALGPNGDLIVLQDGRVTARPLVPELLPAAVAARWRDPVRGGPRL